MEFEDGRIGNARVITNDCHICLDDGLSIVYVVKGRTIISYLNDIQVFSENQLFITQGILDINLKLEDAKLVLITITKNFTELYALNSTIIDNSLLDDHNLEYQHLVNLVKDLIEYISLDPSVYQLSVAESKIISIIHYIVDNLGKKNDSCQLDIEDVVSYMRLNYGNNIGLSEVANKFSVTPQYLSHFFREKHGNTFNQELNDIRLYNATKRLTDTLEPIIDVAYDSGFNSIATFNRVFKKHFKITPLDYRKKYSQNFQNFIEDNEKENELSILKEQIESESISLQADADMKDFILPDTIRLERTFINTIELLNKLHVKYVEVPINNIKQLDLFLYEFNQKVDSLLRNRFPLILRFDQPKDISFLYDILAYFANIIGKRNISKWEIRIPIVDSYTFDSFKRILKQFDMENNFEIVGTYDELINSTTEGSFTNYSIHLINGNSFKDELYQLVKLKELGFKNISFQLPPFKESNLRVLHDTEYFGSTLIFQILKLQGIIQKIDFPPLYDTPSSVLLRGDYGLVSNNGLLKNAFYALQLLARISPLTIFVNERTVISRDELGDFNITIHNHQKLLNKQAIVDYQNYHEIITNNNLKMNITIKGLKNGHYRLKTRSISSKSGNLIKIWEQLGFVKDRITATEGNYISNKTLPDIFLKDLIVENGQLTLSINLNPDEIQNLHLIKLY